MAMMTPAVLFIATACSWYMTPMATATTGPRVHLPIRPLVHAPPPMSTRTNLNLPLQHHVHAQRGPMVRP